MYFDTLERLLLVHKMSAHQSVARYVYFTQKFYLLFNFSFMRLAQALGHDVIVYAPGKAADYTHARGKTAAFPGNIHFCHNIM